jgi:hypothetical protein
LLHWLNDTVAAVADLGCETNSAEVSTPNARSREMTATRLLREW